MRYKISERPSAAGVTAKRDGATGQFTIAVSPRSADRVSDAAFARGMAAANNRLAHLTTPKS